MNNIFNLLVTSLLMGVFLQSCPSEPSSKTIITADTPVIDTASDTPKMAGLSFVACPRPYSTAVMQEAKTVNATWISVIPYAFSRVTEPSVRYNGFGKQWWGESYEGVKTTIDSAHKASIHVLLKPQVYVGDGWTGSLDYKTEENWVKWETDYEKYLMPFVEIAVEKHVEAICIGTEFKMMTTPRETFWRNLIVKIRKKYNGKLTYAANWDDYAIIPFWDALDFVGIDAYMPLLEIDTPSVSALCEAWKPYFKDIKNFHLKVKKPICFTEFGYMSVDGCAGKTWVVEQKRKDNMLKINELAQANALDALFTTFWKESWWLGGFLWKWFPNGQGHEGYIERDYTPQKKQAAAVVAKWYKK